MVIELSLPKCSSSGVRHNYSFDTTINLFNGFYYDRFNTSLTLRDGRACRFFLDAAMFTGSLIDFKMKLSSPFMITSLWRQANKELETTGYNIVEIADVDDKHPLVEITLSEVLLVKYSSRLN